MVDWRLIAVIVVFGAVAFLVRKHPAWGTPLSVAAAVAAVVAGVVFLGLPLIA